MSGTKRTKVAAATSEGTMLNGVLVKPRRKTEPAKPKTIVAPIAPEEQAAIIAAAAAAAPALVPWTPDEPVQPQQQETDAAAMVDEVVEAAVSAAAASASQMEDSAPAPAAAAAAPTAAAGPEPEQAQSADSAASSAESCQSSAELADEPLPVLTLDDAPVAPAASHHLPPVDPDRERRMQLAKNEADLALKRMLAAKNSQLKKAGEQRHMNSDQRLKQLALRLVNPLTEINPSFVGKVLRKENLQLTMQMTRATHLAVMTVIQPAVAPITILAAPAAAVGAQPAAAAAAAGLPPKHHQRAGPSQQQSNGKPKQRSQHRPSFKPAAAPANHGASASSSAAAAAAAASSADPDSPVYYPPSRTSNPARPRGYITPLAQFLARFPQALRPYSPDSVVEKLRPQMAQDAAEYGVDLQRIEQERQRWGPLGAAPSEQEAAAEQQRFEQEKTALQASYPQLLSTLSSLSPSFDAQGRPLPSLSPSHPEWHVPSKHETATGADQCEVIEHDWTSNTRGSIMQSRKRPPQINVSNAQHSQHSHRTYAHHPSPHSPLTPNSASASPFHNTAGLNKELLLKKRQHGATTQPTQQQQAPHTHTTAQSSQSSQSGAQAAGAAVPAVRGPYNRHLSKVQAAVSGAVAAAAGRSPSHSPAPSMRSIESPLVLAPRTRAVAPPLPPAATPSAGAMLPPPARVPAVAAAPIVPAPAAAASAPAPPVATTVHPSVTKLFRSLISSQLVLQKVPITHPRRSAAIECALTKLMAHAAVDDKRLDLAANEALKTWCRSMVGNVVKQAMESVESTPPAAQAEAATAEPPAAAAAAVSSKHDSKPAPHPTLPLSCFSPQSSLSIVAPTALIPPRDFPSGLHSTLATPPPAVRAGATAALNELTAHSMLYPGAATPPPASAAGVGATAMLETPVGFARQLQYADTDAGGAESVTEVAPFKPRVASAPQHDEDEERKSQAHSDADGDEVMDSTGPASVPAPASMAASASVPLPVPAVGWISAPSAHAVAADMRRLASSQQQSVSAPTPTVAPPALPAVRVPSPSDDKENASSDSASRKDDGGAPAAKKQRTTAASRKPGTVLAGSSLAPLPVAPAAAVSSSPVSASASGSVSGSASSTPSRRKLTAAERESKLLGSYLDDGRKLAFTVEPDKHGRKNRRDEAAAAAAAAAEEEAAAQTRTSRKRKSSAASSAAR